MAEDEIDKVTPFTCPQCGHVMLVPLEPGIAKCDRCGYCVECV